MNHLLDRFLGLPVHPLVDHVAVALFPLALLMLLALMVVRSWRARYGWLTMLLLSVGAASVLLAKESGEQLAHHIGVPHRHEQLADALTWVTIPTWALALVWFVLDRGAHLQARRRSASSGAIDHGARPAPSALRGILAGIAAFGALTCLVLVVLVGDTGARAVWADRAGITVPAPAPTAATESPAPASATPTPGSPTSGSPASGSPASGSPASGTPTGASGAGSQASASASAASYTLAQVATHASKSSCWAAIHGQVYDLTDWINQHPGGPEKIVALCGTDATAAFDAQHGHDSQPQQELQQFRIGVLS